MRLKVVDEGGLGALDLGDEIGAYATLDLCLRLTMLQLFGPSRFGSVRFTVCLIRGTIDEVCYRLVATYVALHHKEKNLASPLFEIKVYFLIINFRNK